MKRRNKLLRLQTIRKPSLLPKWSTSLLTTTVSSFYTLVFFTFLIRILFYLVVSTPFPSKASSTSNFGSKRTPRRRPVVNLTLQALLNGDDDSGSSINSIDADKDRCLSSQDESFEDCLKGTGELEKAQGKGDKYLTFYFFLLYIILLNFYVFVVYIFSFLSNSNIDEEEEETNAKATTTIARLTFGLTHLCHYFLGKPLDKCDQVTRERFSLASSSLCSFLLADLQLVPTSINGGPITVRRPRRLLPAGIVLGYARQGFGVGARLCQRSPFVSGRSRKKATKRRTENLKGWEENQKGCGISSTVKSK